jgi:hypothetical protein
VTRAQAQIGADLANVRAEMLFADWLRIAGYSWARYSVADKCREAWRSGQDPKGWRHDFRRGVL